MSNQTLSAAETEALREYLRELEAAQAREPEKLPAEIWDKVWPEIQATGQVPAEYRDRIGVNDVTERKHHIEGDRVVFEYGEQITKGYYDIVWERWNAERGQIEAKYHDVIIKALRYALSSDNSGTEAQPVIELLRQIIGDDDASTLSPEIIRATLPRLVASTPQNYYLPNNKLAKQMTKDLVDGGALELIVSGKKAKREITTRCLLTYEGDRVKLQGQRPFTEFKRTLYNGIVSLFIDGDESHIMTPAMIYRAANGITDGTDPSAGMKAAITRAVNEMRFITAEIDFTDEAKMYRADVDNCYVKDTILDVRELSVSISGKPYTAFYVKQTPLLYEYAQVSKQIASLQPHLLDVRQVPKSKAGKIDMSKEPGGRISNNDRRMAVKSYLLRRVYDMQHNQRLSRNIIFSEMYDEIATESEKTFTAKEQRNIREYIPQVLDYWTHQNFIKGYEAVKGGNKIRGYAIKI